MAVIVHYSTECGSLEGQLCRSGHTICNKNVVTEYINYNKSFVTLEPLFDLFCRLTSLEILSVSSVATAINTFSPLMLLHT